MTKQRTKAQLATIAETSTGQSFSADATAALSAEYPDTSSAKKSGNLESEKDGELDDSSPLWSGANQGWELSWPIWHMLPHLDRKNIAKQHGYKTIGEFEEFMSLQQAVDDSERKMPSWSSSVQAAYPNESIYTGGDESKKAATELSGSAKVDSSSSALLWKSKEDDDDDSSDDEDNVQYRRQSSAVSSNAEDLPLEELMLLAGRLLILHDELLHKVFSWLPVDAYGTLALVSPHWKHLTRTEAVYKRLCERLYLNQSKRRQLHVSRFGNSYRRMLEERPRVRAAGGCYVLKYAQIKQIQRDMWTEVPIGAVLESVYYRYLYFQEDGRVLYALSSAPPHEMFRRLLKVVLHKTKDPAAVWGTFQVQKTSCTIIAKQDWHTVKFECSILPNSLYGKYAALTMDRHFSSPSGCFEASSQDRVEYKVPSELFRFVKDPRL